jgi:hypothetical protein
MISTNICREERGKEKKKRGCLAAAAPVTNARAKNSKLRYY